MAAVASFLPTREGKEPAANPNLSWRGERLVLVKSGRRRKEGRPTLCTRLMHQLRMPPLGTELHFNPSKRVIARVTRTRCTAPVSYLQLSAEDMLHRRATK